LGGAALIVLSAIRCLVFFNPEMPWEIGELALPGPAGGVGPEGTLIADWVSMVTLLAVLAWIRLRRMKLFPSAVAMWAVGGGFVLWHGLNSPDALRAGLPWVGATALGVTALHLAANGLWRNQLLAACVALLVPLGARAVIQVTWEHPATVRYYLEHKAEVLARQGWQEGESEVRRFEGRLNRNDAKGSFSLANVFASVLLAPTAVALSALAGSLVQGRAGGSPWPTLALGGLSGLGLIGLFLTQSRGAMAAFVMGCSVSVCAHWGGKRWGKGVHWRMVCLAPAVLVLAGVLVSGGASGAGRMVGDPSLVVRGWHLEAAWRIWEGHPIVGIGPGSFQEAYMIHKYAMSPENVKDPHNIFAAWITGLGLGGLAWTALVAWMVWRATAVVARADWSLDSYRLEGRGGRSSPLFIGAAGLLFVLQYTLQVKELGPEILLAWILGAVGFLSLLPGLTRWISQWPSLTNLGALAGVLAVVTHGQMEMAAGDPMAASLLMVMLGMGAGMALGSASPIPQDKAAEDPEGSPPFLGWGMCGVVGGLGMGVLFLGLIPLSQASTALRQASREYVAGNPRSAVLHLERAGKARPADPRSDYIRGRLLLQEAAGLENAGKSDEARIRYEGVMAAWDSCEKRGIRRAYLCRRKAEIASRLFQMTGEQEWAAQALAQAEKAMELDPHNRYGAIRMAAVASSLGRCREAATYYEKALAVDDLLTVLPDLRFSADERERVKSRLGELQCLAPS
jgi:hypothetical protein